MKKLFDLIQMQTKDIAMGDTCDGNVLLSPTCEGSFTGEISGALIPVGMGATYSRDPGKNDISSTILLETSDNAKIIMELNAYFDAEYEVEEKMSSGEYVSPKEYYYKGIAKFKTDSEKYKWLERKICVTETEIVSWEKLVTSVYLV